MSSDQSYRPEIDGLRGLSILLVLLFHAGYGTPGGYVGVDVFFVISGFLITGIIQREIRDGTFTIRSFWVRRIRRIYPAAFVMSFVVLSLANFLLSRDAARDAAKSALAHQFLVSNFYFWATSGYFDGASELKPFLHTWSLAVEEQFYLLFPFLPMLAARWGRWWIPLLLALAAISFGHCEYMSRHSTVYSYYMLPARAWEMLAGSLIAALPATVRGSRLGRDALGAISLLLIVIPALGYSSSTRYPGVAALLPVAGAALFIFANTGGVTWPGRLLSLPAVVALGKISYSVYLWHWPVVVLRRHLAPEESSTAMSLVLIAISLALGYLSWRFVEEPVRRRRSMASTESLLRHAAGGVVGLVVVTGATLWGGPLTSGKSSETAGAGEPSIRPLKVLSDGVLVIGRNNRTDESMRFLVWGDSHAAAVAKLFEDLARENGIKGLFVQNPGWAPLLGVYNNLRGLAPTDEQIATNRRIVDLAKSFGVKHVFLVARWECKVGSREPGGQGLIGDERTREATNSDAERVLREGLIRTIEEWEQSGAKVWVLMQPPVLSGVVSRPQQIAAGTAPPVNGQNAPGSGRTVLILKRVGKERYFAQQAIPGSVFASLADRGLAVLGPGDHWFDGKGVCKLRDRGRLLYLDDDHLSAVGAEYYFRPILEPVFKRVAAGKAEGSSRLAVDANGS